MALARVAAIGDEVSQVDEAELGHAVACLDVAIAALRGLRHVGRVMAFMAPERRRVAGRR